MDNKVVQTLARAFVSGGFAAVRFNFRGVGASAGVHDDGQGFDPALTPPGMGSGIMRERAAGIGAELSVASAPGAGTTVTLTWRPNDAAAAAAAPQA